MAPVSRKTTLYPQRSRRSRPQSTLLSSALKQRTTRSTLILLGIVLFWSMTMGWGLAWLAQSSPIPATAPLTQTMAQKAGAKFLPDGAIDPVPENLTLAQSTYLENCATCHIGVPPGVLPTETWRVLLRDPNHYGVELKPLFNPFLQLTWQYLQTYSRSEAAEETVPFRVSQSRFFKALHPGVNLPQNLQLKACLECHPGADQFHFRTLAAGLEKP